MSRSSSKKLYGIFAFLVIAVAGADTATASQTSGEVPPEVFTKCWEYSSVPDLSAQPATDNSRVYFLNTEDKLEAADLRSATKVWSTELGGDVISNLLVRDDALFVTTSSNGDSNEGVKTATLRSLSKQTGVTNWSYAMPMSGRVTLGIVGNTVILVESNGTITARDAATGSAVWQKRLNVAVSGDPHFRPDAITLATADKGVISVAADGGTRTLFKTQRQPTSIMFESDGRYLIGDDRGNLVFTSGSKRPLWKFKHGARISYLLAYESEFLVASLDNFFYKLSRGGNVEWKTRLTGRIARPPIVSGDTAVVSIVGDESVYFIDLHNGKISNRVPTGDDDVAAAITNVGDSSLVLSASRGLALYSREQCPAK